MKRARSPNLTSLPVLLLRGTLIDSASQSVLRILKDAVVGVNDSGRITFVEDAHPETLGANDELVLRDYPEPIPLTNVDIVTIPPRGFLCPGFVDTHTHAPQFAFAGLGYDMELLDWLETYTFPSEAKFKDLDYAAKVCRNAVRRTLHSGSTSCVYFGTIHTDAATLLGTVAAQQGQRSFVGKVNMDRNAPDSYRETTAESIAETRRFVRSMLQAREQPTGKALKGPAPVPVVTPRFVPTCSSELMHALGAIATEHGLLVQSHVSENPGEVAWVKELHPGDSSYTAVYDSHGLLGPKTILAHGVYLDGRERALLHAKRATVSHCPMSNSMLRSGMLNVRRLLQDGVNVTLGTDVSGGASPSMLSAIREALKVSNMVSVYESQTGAALTYPEAYWLATVAGATAVGVDGLTGDLSVGSIFDALVVDPEAPGSPIDLYSGDSPLEAFQKWIQLGDDRNTAEIYVQGKQVHSAARTVEQ